jgi:amino acid adenylation domain-containing protein
MTVDALLDALEAAGVALALEGDRLQYRAPAGALTPELRAELKEHRSEVLATLRERLAHSSTTSPLSWNQLGLWLIHQAEPTSASYHVAFAARLTGPLRTHVLRTALQALVDRHEILRSTCVEVDGQPTLVVRGYRALDFEEIDARGIAEDELRRLARARYEEPFDLSADVMMRARLFCRAPHDHLLLLVWHHIAVDGRSASLLFEEFRRLYEAQVSSAPAGLTRNQRRYADFTAWQHELLSGPDGERLWSYWRERLTAMPPLELPLDRPRSQTRATTGHTCPWSLSADRVERLRTLAASERASLFVVLLSAFKALLSRYTNQSDIVVGIPTFGRGRSEFQDIVGDFVNAIPLRSDLTGDPTFRELIGRVRATALGALDHADYPFALLVRQLGRRRTPERTPIFDVLFNYQTTQASSDMYEVLASGESPGVPIGRDLRAEPFMMLQQEGQFDLALDAIELKGAIHGAFKARTDVFNRATLERMIGHFGTLVDSALRRPDDRISTLGILQAHEVRQLLVEWNGTAQPSPEPLTLHGLFERQVERTPSAPAVQDERTRLTYAELDDRATTIARQLAARGAAPGTRVGIAVERSVDMIAGVLAILKTGAAYVPLDPRYPKDRLEYMVQDSGATLVLVEKRTGGEAPRIVVYLDECLAAPDAADVPLPSVDPDAAAYVMYTSGSTGKPKGVVVPHRAATALLEAVPDRFGTSASDRWVALTTLSFDPSVMEIFAPLSCGARVLVVSTANVQDGARLAEVIDEWQPTILRATPTSWRMLLDAGWRGSPTLTALTGGEPLTSELATSLRSRCGRLFNVYGPTEATIWATAAEVADASAPITIGRPFPHVRTYVLDPSGQLVPVGVPGELYIGGAGVALGYHDRQAMTAERFLPDPFSDDPRARMYRSGDRVRWRPNEELEYLGRLDHQLKVRGHRVEPGEVEAALERHPAVRRAVVVLNPAGEQLIAYVESTREVSTGDLRRFLRDDLPEHMVPSLFQMVAELPVTPNGKVDRMRLPAVQADDTRVIEPARSAMESELVSLWEELLVLRPIGIHDNFFDLGGHSLLATRMCGRLSAIAGRRVHVAELFQAPTIAELSIRLAGQASRGTGLLVPLPSQGSGIPYFCVPGAADNAFVFAEIARHLGVERPVFSFRFPDDLGSPLPPVREVIVTIARRFIEDMRKVHPRGPYLLGGYCGGSVVAFEMANQLSDAGHTVGALTAFDAFLPGGFRMASTRTRIAHHADYFRSLGWSARLMFLARHAVNRLMRLGRRVSPLLGEAAATLASNDDYTPRRVYPGQLTLFRATVQERGLVFEHQMGWRGLAHKIVVHEIEGTHLDLYKEPNVSRWIGTLREVLAQGDSTSLPRSAHAEGAVTALERSA